MLTIYKNMRISSPSAVRKQFLFGSIMAMLFCLFLSRAALSITMIAFVLTALVHPHLLQQLKTFARTPFLVVVSGLFFIPFITGLWSDDKAHWAGVLQVKLPLLFLPLSFAGHWQWAQKRWVQLALVFLLLVMAGTLCSLLQYIPMRLPGRKLI